VTLFATLARLAAVVALGTGASASFADTASSEARVRVALIIDDLGYRRAEGERAVRLPGPVAVAILPHTAHAADLARLAEAQRKEVVLHLPMQALDPSLPLGPGALDLTQTREELGAVLAADLTAVPFARAVSNHMGSLVTSDAERMGWLMEELRARAPLYFVDSYTTARSVGVAAARAAGVPALRRDVFLDGDPAPGALEREWRRLLALARERGTAIGIGHPRPETLEFLERALPLLDAAGVELVPLGALLGAEDPR
jgi:polysaccharide deacetylase 2 family uncharacterized protein YibQ